MTISAIFALITAVLEFPKEVLALYAVLKKTPAENHAALIEKMQKEADSYAQIGSRPEW